jgi:hypothetical protein
MSVALQDLAFFVDRTPEARLTVPRVLTGRLRGTDRLVAVLLAIFALLGVLSSACGRIAVSHIAGPIFGTLVQTAFRVFFQCEAYLFFFTSHFSTLTRQAVIVTRAVSCLTCVAFHNWIVLAIHVFRAGFACLAIDECCADVA